jgi:hypothetical protein
MAVEQKNFEKLVKLYEKRKALDEQIVEAEKVLVSVIGAVSKAPVKTVPRAARKPAAKRAKKAPE